MKLKRTLVNNTIAKGRAVTAVGRTTISCPNHYHHHHHHRLQPLFVSDWSNGIRLYSSTVDGLQSRKSTNNSTNNNPSYISPFQEMFDTINEGKTFLGTTEFHIPEPKFLKCGVPEHVLKFKTTAYGRLLEAPFVRPMEHRVTLKVEMRHIPLTRAERLVLKEIVGNRLDDDTDTLQLSSSQFGSRIENKRHVVSMLERAVESAKQLTARIQQHGENNNNVVDWRCRYHSKNETTVKQKLETVSSL